VHVSVRYEAATDFVREYAENLSRGGLFIRGARALGRHRDVEVEIELPGYGVYQVRAEVVHLLDAASAAEQGRAPGAGLAIRDAPAGFAEALSGYLVRLERRADSRVLVADDEAARLLAAAGYGVDRVESPAVLGACMDAAGAGGAVLIGVVVPQGQADSFRRAARDSQAAALVVPMDGARQIDDVLLQLDRRL
jgi:hypothetical protein